MSDDQPFGAADGAAPPSAVVAHLADYRQQRPRAAATVAAPVSRTAHTLEALRRAGCADELDALLRRHIEGHLARIARRYPELAPAATTVQWSLELLLRLRAGA
jgi:hypothetical protein